jgi:hypothetical protein
MRFTFLTVVLLAQRHIQFRQPSRGVPPEPITRTRDTGVVVYPTVPAWFIERWKMCSLLGHRNGRRVGSLLLTTIICLAMLFPGAGLAKTNCGSAPAKEAEDFTTIKVSENDTAGRCLLLIGRLCDAVHCKPIVALTIVQSTVLLADGITTKQVVARGYLEGDPITRIFIGREPTWSRMAPFGTVQVIAEAWLAVRMKSSRHIWIRRFWWLPQMVGIAGNVWGTENNLKLHR